MSRKNNIPVALRITQKVYPRAEKMMPKYAMSWAVRRFSMPVKYPLKEWEREVMDKAEKKSIRYKKDRISIYEWGVQNNGKWMLLVHGWAGRASQFNSIIRALVEEGYRVVAFDGRAHGQSSGKRTNLLDFRDLIEILSIKYNGFDTIIGHSFGGVASAFALTGAAKSNRLITVNSPTIANEIVYAFVRTINGSKELFRYFYKYIKVQFGRDFDDLELLKLMPQIIEKGLDVHVFGDKDDKEVPFYHTERLINVIGSEKATITCGLGHNKILGDRDVIDKIIHQIKNDKKETISILSA